MRLWGNESSGITAIAEQAEAESGEVHGGDEFALANTAARGRGYAPAGQSTGILK
jgi:hypothetical protein